MKQVREPQPQGAKPLLKPAEPRPAIDLSGCAREPIHIPGSIQSHGCLIACTMPSWLVTHVSANAAGMLGVASADALLGQSIESVLSQTVVHDLRNTLQASMVSGTAETLADARVDPAGLCDIAVHLSGDHVIVELLPKSAAHAEASAPLTLLKSMIFRLKRAPTLERALALSASQVRAVTGFDRVLIYKFLEDGSGQVIAEALRSGLTPFLGLHYPASDIPPQARGLFMRQWLRLIPDVSSEPSILLCQDPAAPPLDLSLGRLRSASPIHLEYLRNMGSAATATISLITGDRLWGLIACHHEVPRRVAESTCAACELFGQVLSLQIEGKEQERELHYIARSREAHEHLIARMPPEETLFDNLARYTDLLTDLIPADGIGVWTMGVFSGIGVLPPLEAMADLIAFLSTKDALQPFSTDSLDTEFPPARFYRDRVSGVLAIPFSRAPRDYLLFFRRELPQVVTWGGNPQKAAEVTQGGDRIGPRKSFAAWREEVRGRSKPWHPAEVKIAEALRISMLDVILRRADLVERERRNAQESQALLIAELNHRVKNILALIRSLVRQSRQGATSIGAFTSDLENRIRALALAHDQMTLSGWTWAPLRRLLEAEAQAWKRSGQHGLIFDGPVALIDPRAYQTLALVFHELMTNAAKYGALSNAQGVLTVKWTFDASGGLEIVWTEQGGPPVQAPSRRGFGTVVVEQTIPFELHGEAEVEYRFEGIRARFRVPEAHVQAGQTEEPLPSAPQDEAAPLRGRHLLIVEDSMMIALDAQGALQEVGVLVDISGSASDAMRVIELDRFDAVVLDINLSGETSFGVADACVARGLPFVFATGYGESVIMPERFKAIPVVPKPYDERALQIALGRHGRTDPKKGTSADGR